jgi:16S rRNA (adenine1518-N6/adenine1519-N6)-dimethyltransferase
VGARPRKSLSQSFLEDERVAAAIVRAARLDRDQDVLEVGPGLGVLTERLAKVARRVEAVEIDPHLADWLRAEFAGRNVRIHTQDILKSDPASFFDAPFVVVANLPYHITSPAVRHLLAAGPPFAVRLVVTVQAEVGDRIAAGPGEMSALAVAIQVQAKVSVLRRVPASAFYPSPKVDSVVVRLEPIAEAERQIQRSELSDFVELVLAGFTQPRKTLANSLAAGLDQPKPGTIERLRSVGIDPGLRPQHLAVADWVRLFRAH